MSRVNGNDGANKIRNARPGNEPIPFAVETGEGTSSTRPAPKIDSLVITPKRGFTGNLRAFAQTAVRSVREMIHEAERSRRLAQMQAALQAAPENTALWHELAAFHEAEQHTDEACACYRKLADLYRSEGEFERLADCYEKLEALGDAEPVRLYRDLAAIYAEGRHFEEGARACRRVVEAYLESGCPEAAIAYLHYLPNLGPITSAVRGELTRFIERAIPATALTLESILDVPVEPSGPIHMSAPLHTSVFLSGALGQVSIFDVVQIAENNKITGQVEVESEGAVGTFSFSEGRIVAAQFGMLTGNDAAKRILELESGWFQVVRTDGAPADEFKASSNTGFLMDVLCQIDEERNEASGHFSTAPIECEGEESVDCAATTALEAEAEEAVAEEAVAEVLEAVAEQLETLEIVGLVAQPEEIAQLCELDRSGEVPQLEEVEQLRRLDYAA